MSSLSAERSRERKGTERIGEHMSRKYTGDRPWIQSYVISAIWNVMRWDTGSQWSVSCNVGVRWSFCRSPVISRTAAWSTACSRQMTVSVAIIQSSSHTRWVRSKYQPTIPYLHDIKYKFLCHCIKQPRVKTKTYLHRMPQTSNLVSHGSLITGTAENIAEKWFHQEQRKELALVTCL